MDSYKIETQIYNDLFSDFIDLLAEVTNFTKLWDYQLNDRSGILEILFPSFRYDFLNLDNILQIDRGIFLHTQSTFKPIDNNEMFLFVTPGEPFSDYEKLLLPFDVLTWIFLLITFGCAFSLIFGINSMTEKIQNLIFGENVLSPAYNVVGTLWTHLSF
jgi:hypothetical protein